MFDVVLRAFELILPRCHRCMACGGLRRPALACGSFGLPLCCVVASLHAPNAATSCGILVCLFLASGLASFYLSLSVDTPHCIFLAAGLA